MSLRIVKDQPKTLEARIFIPVTAEAAVETEQSVAYRNPNSNDSVLVFGLSAFHLSQDAFLVVEKLNAFKLMRVLLLFESAHAH